VSFDIVKNVTRWDQRDTIFYAQNFF